MPQIGVSLSEKSIAEIKKISEATGKPFSRVSNELIEIGLNKKLRNTVSQDVSAFDFQNREYLVGILNVCLEILSSSYDETKSQENHEKARAIVEKTIEGTRATLRSTWH